ncbi:Uncharacterised protein [Mycobacteroides abscessus subsp. abscessus]|nr:Uncharacterised protein [Mycobacteroides abscessus subsp. abscessus]
MLDTQLRWASVHPTTGLCVRYIPTLSATDRPGRSPIRTSTVSTPRAAPMWSPRATRACVATTSGAIAYPRSRRCNACSSGTPWSSSARGDNPSASTMPMSPPEPGNTSSAPSAGARPRSGLRRYSDRSVARLVTSSGVPNPSPSIRPASAWASNGVCTASRAAACAVPNSSTRVVGSASPLRPKPIRDCVDRRKVSQIFCAATLLAI